MPTYKARSRKAKNKRQKAVKRITIFSLLGITTLVLFIFGIVPLSLKILDLLDKGDVVFKTDTIPPSAPNLNVPFSATNSAEIKIDGYTEPQATVNVYLDGTKYKEVKVKEDGSFKVDLTLNEGENQINAESIDQAGNISPKSISKTVVFDQQPPEIEFNNVKNDQEIVGKQHRHFTLEGKTEPNAKIYVNDRFTYANENGEFKFSLVLNEGDNRLKIKVVDPAGNAAETELNIKFKP